MLSLRRTLVLKERNSAVSHVSRLSCHETFYSPFIIDHSQMTQLKNDLLLRTLRGEQTERTPVWMMRQAGRYLPEYRVLREKYGFFERCQTPELAAEITIQPVDIIGVDAAILFSDILVVPQAMGMEVQLIENKGPILPDPIKTANDLKRIRVPDVYQTLQYVFDAIKLI